MNRGWTIGVIAVALAGGAMLNAQSSRNADVQMKAAQQKAEVQGDLKGAIEDYRKVVASAGSNRALAAEALVRIAECYQKLGDGEARRTYEHIVKDFSDQPKAAAIARDRLATLSSSATRGLVARQLMKLPATIATLELLVDGRLAATDWSTGDLVLIDPASGTVSHVVTGAIAQGPNGVWSEDAVLSPDRRQLAYQWFDNEPAGQAGALRVLAMEPGAKPRTLIGKPDTVTNIFPIAWSKDGASILVSFEKPAPLTDGRPRGRGDYELAWANAKTGELKTLKTFEWWRSAQSINSIGRVSLSPDGAWIAYAVADRQGAPDKSIFVMRADGSGERRLVTGGLNDQPVWSEDGSRLIFLSDRSGDPALWSVMAGQTAPHAPTMLKNGVGRIFLCGVLPSGVLVYSEESGADQIVVAELKAAGAQAMPSLRSLHTLNGVVPAWSHDGRYLAYKRRTSNPSRPMELIVRDMESGQQHTYAPSSGPMAAARPTWYHDGTVQAVNRSGVRLKWGTTGLEEVPVPVGSPMGLVSADGRSLFVTAEDGGIDIYDARAGTRTGHTAVPASWRSVAVSHDGSRIALMSDHDQSKIAVIDANGSGFRELPVSSGTSRGALKWTRDGTALLAGVTTGNNIWSIQRVPIDGSQITTIASNIIGLRSFDVTATERLIAYSIDNRFTEVWTLDVKAAFK